MGNKGPFTVLWKATHLQGAYGGGVVRGVKYDEPRFPYSVGTKLGFANISVAVQPHVNLAGTGILRDFPFLILVLLESRRAHVLYCRYYLLYVSCVAQVPASCSILLCFLQTGVV